MAEYAKVYGESLSLAVGLKVADVLIEDLRPQSGFLADMPTERQAYSAMVSITARNCATSLMLL